MSKAPATRTVYHPTIDDVSYVVLESDASTWKDAGWRLTEPSKTTSTTSTKAADSK